MNAKKLHWSELSLLLALMAEAGADFRFSLIEIHKLFPETDIQKLAQQLASQNKIDPAQEGELYLQAATQTPNSTGKALFSQMAFAAITGITVGAKLRELADIYQGSEPNDSARSTQILQASQPLFDKSGAAQSVWKNHLGIK